MLNIVACEVIRVIDGDTIVVDRYHTARLIEKEVIIRLLGVWAPENNTIPGKELTEWLRTILENNWVLLETNNDKRDSFGRLLGIIYPGEIITHNKFILDRQLSYNNQINQKLSTVTTASTFDWSTAHENI